MFDVITFGGAVVDVFVGTDLAERGKFIAYPVGSKILIKELRFDIGGGATNTSVAFSRLGLKTGCVCKIGDDESGKNILKLLKKEKIKFLGKIERGGKSGYSLVLDSKENNRTILTYRGVNNELSVKELSLRKLKTNWIYFASAIGKSFQTQIKLAKLLKARNVKIAFNPGEYVIRRENLSSILKLTDVLILNKEEAGMLTKERDLLFGLHKLTRGIVVITDKNKKIMCYDGKKKYSLQPNKIKVVERTGAGDAFASGFVAGQVAGRTIPESLRLGLRESESVIKYFGAKNNLLKFKLK
jgi:ribokinase